MGAYNVHKFKLCSTPRRTHRKSGAESNVLCSRCHVFLFVNTLGKEGLQLVSLVVVVVVVVVVGGGGGGGGGGGVALLGAQCPL